MAWELWVRLTQRGRSMSSLPPRPDPVAALSPGDSIAPAAARNTEMARTGTERTGFIQGPGVFQGAGGQARLQRGWELVGFCTGFPRI